MMNPNDFIYGNYARTGDVEMKIGGLTKREWFISQAFLAILGNDQVVAQLIAASQGRTDTSMKDVIAAMSIDFADSLIEKLTNE